MKPALAELAEDWSDFVMQCLVDDIQTALKAQVEGRDGMCKASFSFLFSKIIVLLLN
jgi:hypothetical protein